jgi:hypothetical protein
MGSTWTWWWRVAPVTAAWGVFFALYGRAYLAVAAVAVLAVSAAFLAACLVRRAAKQPPV